MTIHRHRSEILTFYTQAMARPFCGDEGFGDPVAEDFATLLDSVSCSSGDCALDLGYGVGRYSIAMALAGFHVDAVDFLPCAFLAERVAKSGIALSTLKIYQTDLGDFEPTGLYAIVVARDVLHFFSRCEIQRLLRGAVRASGASAAHYVTMFTDIVRRERTGEIVEIVGEANFSASEWELFAGEIYSGWNITRKSSIHMQKEKRGDSEHVYFRANRQTWIFRRVECGDGK